MREAMEQLVGNLIADYDVLSSRVGDDHAFVHVIIGGKEYLVTAVPTDLEEPAPADEGEEK